MTSLDDTTVFVIDDDDRMRAVTPRTFAQGCSPEVATERGTMMSVSLPGNRSEGL
jgi:hypothetical protein